MKTSFFFLLILTSAFVCSAFSCNNGDENDRQSNPMASEKIIITVNSQNFTATLLDNNSAKAFKQMLPLTIIMKDLNANEKYYDFPNNLPVDSSYPETITNGDLMLYGSKTLVLFYKSFSTSYSYTKLGTVNDVTGLESALGTGNIAISFKLDNRG